MIKACLKKHNGDKFFYKLNCTELTAPSVIATTYGLYFLYRGLQRISNPDTNLYEEVHLYNECRGSALKNIVLRPELDHED